MSESNLHNFLNNSQYYHGSIREPAGIYKWLSTDNKKDFNKNKKYFRGRVLSSGWNDAPGFEYHINQFGFRDTWDSEFEPGSIMALGCSCTTGIGLPRNDTWPVLLSQQADLPVYNFGMPSCGLESLFRVATYWIKKVRPEYVCLLIPPLFRRELWEPHISDTPIGGWRPIGQWSENRERVHKLLLGEEECWMASQRAVYALSGLCASQHSKLIVVTDNDVVWDSSGTTGPSIARDLIHPGREYMNATAQIFAKAIENEDFFTEYLLHTNSSSHSEIGDY